RLIARQQFRELFLAALQGGISGLLLLVAEVEAGDEAVLELAPAGGHPLDVQPLVAVVIGNQVAIPARERSSRLFEERFGREAGVVVLPRALVEEMPADRDAQ